MAHEEHDTPEGKQLSRGQKRRERTKGKNLRSKLFSEWLTDTFQLSPENHHGVIDIAGGGATGQGSSICYELRLRGIGCTVVDPRPLRRRASRYKKVPPTSEQIEIPAESSLGETDLNPFPLQLLKMFEDDFLDDPEALSIWNKASVVVGMHPDEVTERIVKMALENKKPFAVVPCCVFWKSFPNRKTPEGEPVKSYDQFIEYLLSLSPSISSTQLPFTGRNTVIYKLTY